MKLCQSYPALPYCITIVLLSINDPHHFNRSGVDHMCQEVRTPTVTVGVPVMGGVLTQQKYSASAPDKNPLYILHQNCHLKRLKRK